MNDTLQAQRRCPIDGCGASISDEALMCAAHFARVPEYWRARFKRAEKARRQMGGKPTRERLLIMKEWFYAADCCRVAVNRLVNQTPQPTKEQR